jgi:hypothetical protein
MKNLKEWANQNKVNLLLLFCILYALVLGYLQITNYKPAMPPVQKVEVKTEAKREEKKQVEKQQVLKLKEAKAAKTTTRIYDKETGKVVKEVVKETSSNKELDKSKEVAKVEEVKVEQKADIKTYYKKPYTGLTTGVVVMPSGAGLVAGVTVAEIAPITVSTQVGILIEPQRSITAGISVNGEVATNLEAGIGVYVGPQTSLGYTPVPGLPVSVQPGITLQYRF